MLNVKGQLERMNLCLHSPLLSMQLMRDRIDNAADPRTFAIDVIEQLTGIKKVYENALDAKLIAMGVVEKTVKAEGEIADPEEMLMKIENHVKSMRENPTMSWMFAVEEKRAREQNLQNVIEGVDVKVAIKDNGKIKKGGKQVLLEALYRKHVLEAATPATNQEFIAILMKELNMSKAGATTYAYNAKKLYGEPVGGVAKSARGRKKAQ